MKKLRLLALFMAVFLVLTAIAGCSKSEVMDNMANAQPGAAGDGIYESGKGTDNANIHSGRKLIRTVTIQAETAELDTLLADLDTRLGELGGYVQRKSVDHNAAARHATLTLRIPADKLDAFVGHVEGASNILSSSETADDVTLKYIASQSRVTALETEEARLLELLAKAETLNDLLTLEAKLADLRTELEECKSQLKLYDNLVDYGTVNLTITEVKEFTVVEEAEPTAWERISSGFVNSAKGVWKILTELFIFLIVALPYLAIPAVILTVLLVIDRRKKKARKAAPPAQLPEQQSTTDTPT